MTRHYNRQQFKTYKPNGNADRTLPTHITEKIKFLLATTDLSASLIAERMGVSGSIVRRIKRQIQEMDRVTRLSGVGV